MIVKRKREYTVQDLIEIVIEDYLADGEVKSLNYWRQRGILPSAATFNNVAGSYPKLLKSCFVLDKKSGGEICLFDKWFAKYGRYVSIKGRGKRG